jgi:hypothetical protein
MSTVNVLYSGKRKIVRCVTERRRPLNFLTSIPGKYPQDVMVIGGKHVEFIPGEQEPKIGRLGLDKLLEHPSC